MTTWATGDVITSTFMNEAQRRIEAFAYVEDYGAVGDGTTDDRSAIQAAFNGAKTVAFKHNKTYKVSDTLYLSGPHVTTVVKNIIGNGATLNFSGFTRSCTTTLERSGSNGAIFGLVAASTSTGTEYQGWHDGVIRDLNLTTSENIIMLGVLDSDGLFENVTGTSSGTSVKGGLLVAKSINAIFRRCKFNLTSVETDTTGSGSYTTDSGGFNIPSSFAVFLWNRLGRQDNSSGTQINYSGGSGFNDQINFYDCQFVGGYVNFIDGGGNSHVNRVYSGNEFAYAKYGLAMNSGAHVIGNWFENHFTTSLHIVGTTPWWNGTSPQPCLIEGNSFAPHNTAVAITIQNFKSGSKIARNLFSDNSGGAIVCTAAASQTLFLEGNVYASGSNTLNPPNSYFVKNADGVNSGPVARVVSKTADYTITVADDIVFVSASGGNVTLTLPAANALGASFAAEVTVKRTDSSANTVTVQRAGADTLDGGTSTTIAALNAKTFVSDGTSVWGIV